MQALVTSASHFKILVPTEGFDSGVVTMCDTCGVHSSLLWVAPRPDQKETAVTCVMCAAGAARAATGGAAGAFPYQLIKPSELRVLDAITHINTAAELMCFINGEHDAVLAHVAKGNTQHAKSHEQFMLPDLNLLDGADSIITNGGVIWQPSCGSSLHAIIGKLSIRNPILWTSLMHAMQIHMDNTDSMLDWITPPPDGIYKPSMKHVHESRLYAKFSLDSITPLTPDASKSAKALGASLSEVVGMLHADFPSSELPGEFAVKVTGHLYRATMLMVGGEGVGTGFHVDWSNALNFAFGLSVGKAGDPLVIGQTPLAAWLFIRPTHDSMARVSQWLIEHVPAYRPHGIQYPNWVDRRATLPQPSIVPYAAMQLMAQQLSGDVFLAYQHHGCLMNAPVGWPHAVTNLVTCAKIAFDYICMEDLPKIALSHQHNIVGFFRQFASLDYTSAIHSACHHAVHLATQIKNGKAGSSSG